VLGGIVLLSNSVRPIYIPCGFLVELLSIKNNIRVALVSNLA
jgi:hypothetical protein